jgi:hypothetical protein
MEFGRHRHSLDEVKAIDIVSYLATLGYQPSKIRNNDYWYLSPLRNEKTPSFKVNYAINRWYDHGLGKGGSFIDFAILYHDCTVGDLLRSLTIESSFQRQLSSLVLQSTSPENRLTIVEDCRLTSAALISYMRHRRIPLKIADRYCREVHYNVDERAYYGIGFRNDLGGWEIRNAYFKGSSSPKCITTFDKGSNKAIVFEGFIDFLSFRAIHQNEPEDRFNFLVLNSLSFFESARPFMEKHGSIKLYLDRDMTGQNCSRYALSLSSKYHDESSLYRNHKDFNDWIMYFGVR